MITLAPLDASHRAAVHDLLDATASFHADEIAVALEVYDEACGASGTGTPDYEFVAAFDEAGALAGFCSYGPTPGTEGTYDVYWIAVHPARQHGGVGTQLLAEVERRLARRGARLVVVETSGREGYDATRRFYGARGYRVAAQLRDFYAPADDRIVFTRQLGNSSLPAHRGA
ncbi:MAG TPA: GNAT family N-acetyltransferase [Gemmatimonadaceae bacterium]|nr:GNAT family N-acetyltransferase [Gemmatimonadaceae bacterium]